MSNVAFFRRRGVAPDLELYPRLKSLAYLCVLMWICAVGVLAVGIASHAFSRGPGEWIPALVGFLFFLTAPLVVWRGSRIVVNSSTVAIRSGYALWHEMPRSEIRLVEFAPDRPRIHGEWRALVPHKVWTEEQLRKLAAHLDVPFRTTPPRSLFRRRHPEA